MLCVKIIFLNKGDVKMTNEIQAAVNVLAPGMTVSWVAAGTCRRWRTQLPMRN